MLDWILMKMMLNRTEQEAALLKALNDIPMENKTEIIAAIFRCITQQPPCSFRRMIYERLGLEPKDYETLYRAGGMVISNALHSYSDESSS